jgi:anti-sigma B factor antagonist
MYAQLGAPGGLLVACEVVGHAVVVRVRGEIDMSNAELLDEQLQAARAVVVPPAPVVLDLTGVSFLPSTGLELLIIHHDRCAEHGSPLRVVATHRQVLRPIQITGLDQKLVIVSTVGDALTR